MNNKATNLYYDTIDHFEWEREQFNKRMIELYPADGYNQHRVVTRKDIRGDDFYYPANANQLFKVPKLSTKEVQNDN